MAAVGIFPMEPTKKSKVSVVPITLTPELLRTLEEMMRMGRGAAVKFDSKGKNGQLIISGHQPAEFSLSQTKPLPHILKEAENKVEVFRPVSTSLVVDSWQKGAVRGGDGRLLKRKHVDSMREQAGSSTIANIPQGQMKAKDVTGKKTEAKSNSNSVETTTPESGYGTDLSTRLGEFEDEEKVQDADELSEETPFKPKRSKEDLPLPAPLPRLNLEQEPSKAPPPASSLKAKPKMLISIPRKRLMVFPNVDTSFLKKYPPLRNERDRRGYKAVYEKCYQESYSPLMKKLEARSKEWKRLDSLLQKNPSNSADIMAKMAKISGDRPAVRQEQAYWKYLHEKLAHIKRMGAEWDLKQE